MKDDTCTTQLRGPGGIVYQLRQSSEALQVMIDPELLKILCCPETHQPVALADQAVIEKLNAQMAAGAVKNRAGQPVTKPIDGGLVRADGRFLYPIRQNIPILLIDEALPLPE